MSAGAIVVILPYPQIASLDAQVDPKIDLGAVRAAGSSLRVAGVKQSKGNEGRASGSSLAARMGSGQ